jgi:hypothetical protein
MRCARKNKSRLPPLTACFLSCLLCLLVGACSEPPNPNKLIEYTLRGDENLYTVTLPETYKATKHFVTKSGDGIWIYAIYPTMQAPRDQVTLDPSEIGVLVLASNKVELDTVPNFLKEGPSHYVYMGKQGIYDIYQKKAGFPGIPVSRVLIFTAKDGESVLVEILDDALPARLYRNIGPEIAIKYHIGYRIGNDYLQIDETVKNFIKSHIKSA